MYIEIVFKSNRLQLNFDKLEQLNRAKQKCGGTPN